MAVKKGLGKGLNALITNSKPLSNENDNTDKDLTQSSILEIELHKIEPNSEQPRQVFNNESLEELAESIKNFGIIQPLIVKKESGYFSIIAGERRWRAARLAGLERVPVIVKDYTELEILEAALIENIQREDLNPIEEAICYKRLMDEVSFTQDQLAKRIGKNRSRISNALRILQLDNRVQTFIAEGRLSMGHARALLPLPDNKIQFEMAEKIIEDSLSVREIENMIRLFFEDAKNNETIKENKKRNTTKREKPHFVITAESNLQTILGTKVIIEDGDKKGKIEIEYYSKDEFDRLLVLLRKIDNN